MEKIHILGTGNAMVTKCFNTCFTISNKDEHFLVDTGGGNGILKQLKEANIAINDIKYIFVSHNHIDHIMGVIWLIRAYAASVLKDSDQDNLVIYGHDEVVHIINTMIELLLNKKQTECLKEKLSIVEIHDKDMVNVMDYKISFTDLRSGKDKQFGARFDLPSGKSLMFLGDEPYREHMKDLCEQVDYLLHEAFCLYEERALFTPYKRHHCTVKEACENAKELQVKNLIIYHTEEKNLENRQVLYSEEARNYYSGPLYIPYDLDVIDIK